MKVGVYSIALNEAQFVERWAISAVDADLLFIADTGSTDDTVKIAKSHGVQVAQISVKPWRFDDSRNVSLGLLPADLDYCIALDIDEVLIDGWREELEKAHAQKITRPRYKYTWSWDAQGKPGLIYGGDKIHARHGYRWVHPAHEVLMPDRIQETQEWFDIEIHHHPDETKPRSQYLELLALGANERPWDSRDAFYYARELLFAGRLSEAKAEFERYLSLPSSVWIPQRAEACRYVAKCVSGENELLWINRSIAEDPSRREGFVAKADWHYRHQQWKECLQSAEDALKIKEKKIDYFSEEQCWSWLPYDLAAIAAYKLGISKKALQYGQLASKQNPHDARLKENLSYYRSMR